MGYRSEPFAPGNFYHICHRGVAKANIFSDDRDRQRFLTLLQYYLPAGQVTSYSQAKLQQDLHHKELTPSPVPENEGLVNLLCYCLMDNHIHLLLHENIETGISTYAQRLFNSYARYFNTLSDRSGSLFTGRFKAVLIDGDEQFLHISRYIHLNPFVAGLVRNPTDYRWSSLTEYAAPRHQGICHTRQLKELMKPREYADFVTNYANYARELEDIKHLTLE